MAATFRLHLLHRELFQLLLDRLAQQSLVCLMSPEKAYVFLEILMQVRLVAGQGQAIADEVVQHGKQHNVSYTCLDLQHI